MRYSLSGADSAPTETGEGRRGRKTDKGWIEGREGKEGGERWRGGLEEG